MPKMRLKLDQSQTSGFTLVQQRQRTRRQAEGSLAGRHGARIWWIWVSSMGLPRIFQYLGRAALIASCLNFPQ